MEPHPSIDSLLQQVEDYRLRRKVRDARPDRVTRLISELAELFEPFHGVGRVGFDCYASERGWTISMFLGATEVVGGRDDGLRQHPAFHFDLESARGLFSKVHSLRLTTCPAVNGETESGLTLHGCVDEFQVCLLVHAVAPEGMSPGLQRMPDRSLRLT